MKKIFQKAYILPLIVVLALALVIFKVTSKPPVAHEVLGFPTKTVEVITAKLLPFRSHAVAYGHVEPAVLLKAKAEVSGKISYLHPALKQGGSLAAGTLVLRIEPTTFEFSRDQSAAGLSASQSTLRQLEVEEETTRRSLNIARRNLQVGEKELARLETIWKEKLIARAVVDTEEQKVLQLRQQVEDLQGKLASYTSRKAAIMAQIKQSKTQLAQSQDTLGRTEIRLPFDARIGSVNVEEGEFVGVGNVLFEALGTEAVEIDAQLPTRQFRPLLLGFGNTSLNLQDPDSLRQVLAQMELEATVHLVGQERSLASWQGELLHIGESIDPLRDTIGLTIRVDQPYENVIPGIRPPLLKGMYTAVELSAPPREALVLPRKAIHQGRVYIATPDDQLTIRAVNIVHKQGTLVVVDGGIEVGERVIITDVIPVIEGLPLKPVLNSEYEQQLAQQAQGRQTGQDNQGGAL
ncbi:MAG TPA: HlyD family secretion protein [Candidatus Tenderia sp.]|nr:HlyD family secretion protein [Candidatus Tenderia sp.]